MINFNIAWYDLVWMGYFESNLIDNSPFEIIIKKQKISHKKPANERMNLDYEQWNKKRNAITKISSLFSMCAIWL